MTPGVGVQMAALSVWPILFPGMISPLPSEQRANPEACPSKLSGSFSVRVALHCCFPFKPATEVVAKALLPLDPEAGPWDKDAPV